MHRSPTRWIAAAALAALVAGAACSEGAPARAAGGGGGPEAGALRGTELDPSWPKPDFTLTDTEGGPFDFRARTDGFVTLLFFGYTHCPDVCPVHMANIAAVLADLDYADRARIRVVFVTTDPERDTPGRLREWLDRF
ncbi:MAG TPA: SCO family protein, partial [Thermoanaerobaculia bacterium]